VITADSEQFVSAVDVSIATPTPEVEVRYTLDGSTPTPASALARDPLRLTATTAVKACTFHRSEAVSKVVERRFVKVQPSAPVQPVAPNQGLRVVRLPMIDWNRIPDDPKLWLVDTWGTSPTVTCGKAPGEHTALRFSGFLDAPRDELYRFALASDDGSKLWIDGQLVVDNDGLHGMAEVQGARALGQGLHPIEVVWFNKTGGAELQLRWAPPGAKFAEVPASALRH
jgi:hypothetical protein